MSSSARVSVKANRLEEILFAAAECFQQQGFAATSIDTVARHLGATKGRIYHYFPSKMDLFNAVRDRAMELAFEAVKEGYESTRPTEVRLGMMVRGQALGMMQYHSFMQVLLDGLRMRRYGATTEFQRQAMALHLEQRDAFEAMYREVLSKGHEEGLFKIGRMSITLRSFVISANSPVFWYQKRDDDDQAKLEAIADEIVAFAMRGLGVDWPDDEFLHSNQVRQTT